MQYINNPNSHSYRVAKNLLAGAPEKWPVTTHNIDISSISSRDRNLYSRLELVVDYLEKDKKIYIYGNDEEIQTFIVCFFIRYNRWGIRRSIRHSNLLFLSKEKRNETAKPDMDQISRYRRPLTVITCGDRDSRCEYRPVIKRALKNLPPNSTVVHGGCRGIDIESAKIAKKIGLKVISYPISEKEWRTLGRAAGPVRNRRMLETKPDMVLAFHPDVTHSKGTKNMMITAHSEGIPVYLYDLKSKKKFEGDMHAM